MSPAGNRSSSASSIVVDIGSRVSAAGFRIGGGTSSRVPRTDWPGGRSDYSGCRRGASASFICSRISSAVPAMECVPLDIDGVDLLAAEDLLERLLDRCRASPGRAGDRDNGMLDRHLALIEFRITGGADRAAEQRRAAERCLRCSSGRSDRPCPSSRKSAACACGARSA